MRNHFIRIADVFFRFIVAEKRRATTVILTLKNGFVGLVLVSAVSLSAIDFAAAADPVKPGGVAAHWKVKPDPPTQPVEWPASLAVSIQQPPRIEEILFPQGHSPFCMVGLDAYESQKGELWNLATGKRVGAIQGTPPKAIKRALSADGKYMALAILDRAQANDIEVWSLETGKQISRFQADERNYSMTILDFAGPDEVLTYTLGQTNGKFGHHLRVWDAKTGNSARQIDLDKNLSGDQRYDISPGRNLLVSIMASDAVIYDLQTGQEKGTITPPNRTEDGQSVSLDGVRFSPDGTELGCLCSGGRGSIIATYDLANGDQKSKCELTAAMKASLQHPASYKGPALEYVSQPNGFLWYGSGFVDRETGLLLWTYKQGILEFSHWRRIITPAGMIVSTGGNGARKIQVVPFPAEDLEQALTDYRSDKPALIKPGEKVKVVVKVTEVRFGTKEEATKAIEEVLAERLADDGLEVADDGNTILNVKYKEGAGKVLKEIKGGSSRGGGTPTGRTVQSTAAEVDLSWTTKDGKTKVFAHKLDLDPSMLTVRTNEEVTAAVAHKQVFAILKLQLAGLPMPFFVPLDKSGLSLPMVSNSSMAAPLSKADALKKKIEARKNLGKK
ncbi:MAG: hypothetical protein JSS49_19145 [Planctomycetes bacterium]|nr:hypothetical protein [Planctomycetota bacterium]